MQVEDNPANHRQHEGNRQSRCRAVRGRKASDRNNRGQMIETDHRMTQSRQDALTESCGRAATHHVMRESRC